MHGGMGICHWMGDIRCCDKTHPIAQSRLYISVHEITHKHEATGGHGLASGTWGARRSPSMAAADFRMEFERREVGGRSPDSGPGRLLPAAFRRQVRGPSL